MASSVIRRAWFGWLNPNAPAQSGARTATASSVALTFSGAILPASPAIGQFAVTVNAVARGVTAAAVAGSVLTLTLASAVTAGQSIIVTYTPGGVSPLKDADGDLISAFTTPAIIAT
jgi:uncharacterized repeat protein (TIGR02059 family)